ncbi:PREDICTED: protein AKNAD1 [Tinamus guttatus]|uniref:protein AKNAD1 n=1 Tax=Tinamus guttatus TaxID=94827 RepID=UPI00052F2AEC|nr:PREDICTED: protein AKNAD1 [Tinamus guttatus]
MKKGNPSFIPMNVSFLDELDCIPRTTDEENEDLPSDGNLRITCQHSNYSDDLSDCACIEHISDIFFNVSSSEDNKNIKASADAETHPQAESAFNCHARAPETPGVLSKTPVREACLRSDLCVGGFRRAGRKEHLANSKMSDVLLRHFSKGELITTCQLIECETIPEISFTDSIDEASSKLETSELAQSSLSHGQPPTNLENYCLEKCEKIDTGEKDHTLLNKNTLVSERAISETSECGCIQRSSPLSSKNEDTFIFQNPTKQQRDPFERTASSQCDKSQVHYYLPHFSEVAKGPKRNSNNKPVSITERTKAFPISPNKSVTVNDIVENKNCFDSVEIENQEEMSVSELLQQLQILSQSAFPNPSFAMYSGGTETSSGVFALYPPMLGLSEAGLQCGTMVSTLPPAGTVQAHRLKPSNLLPELTQGQKMTQILQEQTDQLKKKVEDLSQCKIQETFLLQDKHLVLNHLKRCLDALEQNYLTAKEEHCNLQLQNNKDTSIDVGKFDPDRKVEGEIFRLGMLLEDIHEETDDSKCSSPPLLTPYESACSSYSLWEGSGNSSIIDPPERIAVETAFLYKNNKEKNISHTTDAIPQTNHRVYLEGDKHNPYPCVHISICSAFWMQQRFLDATEKIHGAEGLGSYPLGKLGQKSKADEESMERSLNFWQIVSPSKARSYNICSVEHDIHLNTLKEEGSDSEDISACNSSRDSQSEERLNHKTENHKILNTGLHGERKGSDSEDISACNSSSDSQSEELLNHKTENHMIFNTGLHGERKGFRQKCTRGSRDQSGQALESDPWSRPRAKVRSQVQGQGLKSGVKTWDKVRSQVGSQGPESSSRSSPGVKVRSQFQGQDPEPDPESRSGVRSSSSPRSGVKAQSLFRVKVRGQVPVLGPGSRSGVRSGVGSRVKICSQDLESGLGSNWGAILGRAYSKKIISCTQKAYRHKLPHHLVKGLSERKNMETVKTCYSSMYDTVILSPHLPRKTTSRRKSAVNIRNTNMSISDTNFYSIPMETLVFSISTAMFYYSQQILSSTLDHAIQTANSLKRTTERMVQAVSEDLAKVRSKQL